jgi:hypothetical protein
MPKRRDFDFIVLHVDMADHPKIVNLTDGAHRLFVESIAYAVKHHTDGVVPTGYVSRRHREKEARELCGMALYEVTSEGFLIHDFRHYQLTEAEMQADRHKRQNAARIANEIRWQRSRQPRLIAADGKKSD